MNLDDERGWVEQARQDPEAFKHLYRHYVPRLYAYVSYRVGRSQDTEDFVAETFLKAVEGIQCFEWRREGSFAAWIFSIAHNLISTFWRRDKRQRDMLPLDVLPEIQAHELLPDDVVLQKENFAHLRSLIGMLSPRQQEVITLKFFGGLRNQEIAEILELNERTVAAYLCRGLEELHGKYVGELARTKKGGSR